MSYFFSYALLSLRKLVYYRANFLLAAFANLVHYGTSLTLITILMNKFGEINGWKTNDVVFLYAFALLSFSIFGVFFQQLAGFSNLIIRGRLDRMILRPRSIFIQVVLEGINPIYLSHLFFAVSLLAYVMHSSGYVFSADQILLLAIAAICGVVIQISIALIASSMSFFTLESGSLFNLFVYGPRELIWYPISIYPNVVQSFLIFVVPFAFINYFPVRSVLKIEDGASFSFSMGWMSILAALCVGLIAAWFWRFGFSKYSSTGS